MASRNGNSANSGPTIDIGSNIPASGVYFLSIELQNIRCFGDEKQSLDLSDGNGRPARWTVILGDNGTGKTTALHALASFLWYRAGGQSRRSLIAGASLHDWVRVPKSDNSIGESGILTHRVCEMKSLIDQPKHVGPSQVEIDRNGAWQFIGFTFVPMMCVGYGANRRSAAVSLSGPNEPNQLDSLFDDAAFVRNPEEWLLQADYVAAKAPNEVRLRERFDEVKRVLLRILPDVEDLRIRRIESPEPHHRVEFATPFGWVSFSGLSLGFRTTIAWMVDFASRLFEAYPDSRDPLAEPAVCLVDEIDLHLHPKWQRKLMNYLTERFPNTQFIVTAHSPLMVQAAAGVNANIAVFQREGDHVVIRNDVETIRGWRIDQVLTSDLFGLESARDPVTEKLLNERRELLEKTSPSAADLRRASELDDEIGMLPTSERAADDDMMLNAIRDATEVIKQSRATKTKAARKPSRKGPRA